MHTFGATSGYFSVMWYLACIPSLICGLAVSVNDIRCRRVPRLWIAVGVAAQLIATCMYALLTNNLFVVLQSLLFALLCAAVQVALALMKPGALGFGDVTTTLVIGLAVGLCGLQAIVIWWLAMGLLGVLWIAFWTRFDPQRGTQYAGKTPFAPVIVLAGVVALLASTIM